MSRQSKTLSVIDTYAILGWIAIVAVPVAPAFFFGHRVYTAVAQLQDAARWAFPVGVLSALGLELVGILAGHIAMDYWRRNDYWRAGVAGLIMVIYVIIGVYELRGTIGAVMFLIAPLVYVLVALRHSLQVVEAQEAPVKQRRLEFDLEQEAKDKELERELKRQRQQDKTAVKLAQIERTDLDTSKTDWRTLTNEEKIKLLSYSTEEIVSGFGVSHKTADRWLERAGKLSEKVPQNGHVKEMT